MRPRSLSARLLLTSLLWSTFALVVTGVVLVGMFREGVERRFDDTLTVYLSLLIGDLADTPDPTAPTFRADLSEPRFVLTLSGWYWSVRKVGHEDVIQASESLAGDTVGLGAALDRTERGEVYRSYVLGPAGDEVRLIARRVAFGDGDWFLVAVTGAADEIREDTQRFVRQVALTLGVFALSLLGITFLQWRIGLRPLRILGDELRRVREGTAARVSEAFPTEIVPVARALNTLLESNRATLERARNHVGNLAHALKTPISVLVNDAGRENNALAASVREQTAVMQRQVRYYLERAQIAAKERLIGAVTQVRPTLLGLHRALARLGAQRGVVVRLEPGGDVRFAGERQDFEEIVGNLLDNALKWAASEVVIAVDLGHANGPPMFAISIDDDGPGLTKEEAETAIARGRRLDLTKPGSGLGLSIVDELVQAYGGSLELMRSQLGGLRATVRLPRA